MRYVVTILLTICVVLSLIYKSMLPHLTTWIVSDYTVTPQDFQIAEQGNPQALYKIGSMYYASKQYTKSAPFFQQATDQNHEPALKKLVYMYQNGIGVKKDLGRASQLLLKSSLNGNLDSIENLGNNIKETLGIK